MCVHVHVHKTSERKVTDYFVRCRKYEIAEDFGIQSDSNPYRLVMNLYTVDGISINVHDFLFPRGSTLVYRTYHLSGTF